METRRRIERAENDKAAAETANREKQKFMRYIMHEVRVPFHVLSMGIDSLLDDEDELDKDHIDTLSTMKQAREMMLGVLDDVLDLQKIEEGKMELFPAFVSLSNMLTVVVQPMKLYATGRGLTLIEDASVLENDIKVNVDAPRLRQVVANLISNAIKFTPAGGYVTVRTARKPARSSIRGLIEGTSCLLPATIVPLTLCQDGRTQIVQEPCVLTEVEDNGTGVRLEDIDRLFQVFSQVGTHKLDSGNEGSGLGLSIAKSIVELHGGRVGVQSVAGHGSRFFFVLPLVETPESIDSVAIVGPEQVIFGPRVPEDTTQSDIDDSNGPFDNANVQDDDGDRDTRDPEPLTSRGSNPASSTMPPSRTGVFVPSAFPDQLGVIAGDCGGTSERHTSHRAPVPAPAPAPAPTPAPNPHPQRAQLAVRAFEGLRILVVDDVVTVVKLTTKMLEKNGATVDTATNGLEAVERIKERIAQTGTHGYNLILLDKEMPVMDGFEAVSQIRTLPGCTKGALYIIGLTGNALQCDVDEFKARGVDEVLTKPMPIERLKGIVTTLQ